MATTGAGTALSAAECDRLMSAAHCGRLAVTRGALPVIIPVRLDATDGPLIHCTSAAPDSAGTEVGAVVALQVGGCDDGGERGWSVLVQGTIAAAGGQAAPPGGQTTVDGPRRLVINASITKGYRFRWDVVQTASGP